MSRNQRRGESGAGLSPDELLRGSIEPRLRASFSGLIGILVMISSLLIRVFYHPTSAEILEGRLVHTGSAVGLVSVCLLAAWIGKPNSFAWWHYGTWPFGGLLAVLLPLIAPLQPEPSLQLYLLAIETSACLLILLSLVSWASVQSFHRASLEVPSPKARISCIIKSKESNLIVSSIEPKTEIQLRPGDDVPLDGVLLSGSGFVDEKTVFGTNIPVAKQPGDLLFAGTRSTIPEGLMRSEISFDHSYALRRRLIERVLLRGINQSTPAHRAFAFLSYSIVLVVAVFIWSKLSSNSWSHWLVSLSGLFILGAGVVPVILLARGRSESLRRGSLAGVLFGRLRDLENLGGVSRWQIDPRLLASVRNVSLTSLDEAEETAKLLQVAHGLSSELPTELLSFALSEYFTTQDVPNLRAAALKQHNGVFYGTVRGERWCLGTQGALEAEEKIEFSLPVVDELFNTLPDDSMVWFLAQPGKGLRGAIVFEIETDQRIGKLARSLGMSLMPGLSDRLREIVARGVGIEKDKPPIGRRGGSLLLDSSPRPSAGLSCIVVEPGLELEVNRGRSPRIMKQALSGLPRYLEEQRSINQRRRAATMLGGIAPLLLGSGLALVGWFGPWTASFLMTGSILFSLHHLRNSGVHEG